MKKNKIGIDFGGTKLLGVIVDSSYNILKKKMSTDPKNIDFNGAGIE